MPFGEGRRKILADGIDPGVAKQEARREALDTSTNTFKAVAREWDAGKA